MSPLLDSEAAMEKMLAFVRTLVPAKKANAEAGWADKFVGAWKDDRSADEIVDDIRSARTSNTIDVELCPARAERGMMVICGRAKATPGGSCRRRAVPSTRQSA